jgi:hypothetical protein
LEGDDAKASEEEGGRRAASDAGGDDECSDITFVGLDVLVEVTESMEGEMTVEEGGRAEERREAPLMT